ncbi:tetratricopeptide repeat protein [Saccharothrix australiensis]|uniref:tetratricopeptide repeat protein n=1 Tax=Saccharothrix australiensis TaxID=2072 RepID=UPI001476B741|nr:tetratricopeptide repeat protein [Saccharothrix australiensis]
MLDLFVGRDVELSQLEASVAKPSRRTVVVVIHGLGGVGKSALANRFAHLRAEQFSLVWWICADSPAAFTAGLAVLGVFLDPQVADRSIEQQSESAITWLASHDGWMLVLDDLANPGDAVMLLEWLWTGTVVITSRRATGWGSARTLRLDELPRDQAVELLTKVARCARPHADLTDADLLCRELGNLPLAIEQAASFLASAAVTPSRYLELLREQPSRMLAARSKGGDTQRTLAQVWRVALDSVVASPLAGMVLRVLAWFAPSGIPRSFLDSLGDELEICDALSRLATWSMIGLAETAISVHPLVQAAARTPEPTGPHRRSGDIAISRDFAADAIVRALHQGDRDKPSAAALVQAALLHARTLIDRIASDTETAATCRLLNELGTHLKDNGDPTAAIGYLARAHRGRERIVGRDHPDTLDSLHDLAHAYRLSGDSANAIHHGEITLASRQRVLGRGHPDTVTSRHELARALESSGALDRAILLYEAVLTSRVRQFGFDHSAALDPLNDLARTYRSSGDPVRAVPLYGIALASLEGRRTDGHPTVVALKIDFGHACCSYGDYSKAIPLYESALVERERDLGRDHPDTVDLRRHLALACGESGELRRAVSLYERVLESRRRVLGDVHPDTLGSSCDLAHACWIVGDTGRAILICKSILVDCRRALGPHHPTSNAVIALLSHISDEPSPREP